MRNPLARPPGVPRLGTSEFPDVGGFFAAPRAGGSGRRLVTGAGGLEGAARTPFGPAAGAADSALAGTAVPNPVAGAGARIASPVLWCTPSRMMGALMISLWQGCVVMDVSF